MKKALFLLVLCGVASGVMAQESKDKPKDKPKGLKSYAAVKWNPASLAFGKLSLFGEYNYRAKRSITVGIGIPMEKSHSFDIDKKSTAVTTKTTSFMGGYRMYMGKKSMSGFYFEPYLKYTKNELGTILRDVDLEGQTADFLVASKYSGFGGGFQLGLQMTLFKRVTLDLMILGLEGSSAKHTMFMQDIKSSIPWDQVDEDKAEKEITDITKDIPLIGSKIKVTADKNTRTISSEYKGFWPGYRGGITIGVKF
ncbi:MAG: hypothetical protein JWP27_2808 [Flaviaesturariibacter sp.]|nr:hypothetical protein [Flaviaesturariibacter sp.]